MDNVEMVTRTCKVCGKDFQEAKCHTGNRRKYCSEECRKKFLKKYRNEYFKKRYYQDDEYRKRVREDNARRLIENRKKDKATALRQLAEELYYADTIEDIEKILTEKTTIKAELYDKYAHSLRVPKESRL